MGRATIFASRPDSRCTAPAARMAAAIVRRRSQILPARRLRNAAQRLRFAVWALKAQAGRRVTSSFSPPAAAGGSSSATRHFGRADARQIRRPTAPAENMRPRNQPVDSSIQAMPAGFAGNHRRQIIARAGVQQGFVGQRAGARRSASRRAAPVPWPRAGLRPVRRPRPAVRPRPACPGSFPVDDRESPPWGWHFPLFRGWSVPGPAPGRPFGVLEKHLIEIAHAKQQDRVGQLALAS